jgi:hypothetical protein
MTVSSEQMLETLQREVQRLLGRCLLILQQYERQLKSMVVHQKISGSLQSMETDLAARKSKTAGKTLGRLTNEFLGTYIAKNEFDAADEEMNSSPEDVFSYAVSMGLKVSDEEYTRIGNGLKELLLLRNDLVHHFIDQYDLMSLEGCNNAQDALVATSRRIELHYEQLREWAGGMQQTAEPIQSAAMRELLENGIAPDGTVYWPLAGIVDALREAAGELAVDGWASVEEAGKWIAKRHPEQLPAKYGCSSWRHVVHQSLFFELRKFEIDGQRYARYREKEKSEHSWPDMQITF